MSINLDQAQQTFIVEARELLQAMEESLLQLESEPGDQGAIGAIFRAAHTIKGSAGLFGLTPIVSFTHIVEDVLDRLREGSVAVDAGLIAVLLKSGDHMLELIEVVASRGEALQPAALEREAALRQALQIYQAPGSAPAEDTACAPDAVEGEQAEVVWHISLRFGVDVFRNGMDPLSFLRYLNTLGQMIQVTTVTTASRRWNHGTRSRATWVSKSIFARPSGMTRSTKCLILSAKTASYRSPLSSRRPRAASRPALTSFRRTRKALLSPVANCSAISAPYRECQARRQQWSALLRAANTRPRTAVMCVSTPTSSTS